MLQPLAIEPPTDTFRSTATKGGVCEEVHTLDLGEGNVVKLDDLGPMIINSDGVSESFRHAIMSSTSARCRL